jgi:hypothetical protein
VQEQDSTVAVGVTEDSQANPFNLFNLAAFLFDLLPVLSHEAKLKNPATKLLPPRLLIADRNSLTLKDLLHRKANCVSLYWRKALDPPQTGFVAIVLLKEVELIWARNHLG